jgi:poly-gamma-glutamate capsule biosynthesis protein CapA/YwtB (metallophosphatase superfamily)
LCGDVMTGRGIDQVLARPCDPKLHEDYVASAMDYVGLAEHVNGPIPRHAEPSYVWGAALDELNRMQPDARIINLETAITRSDDYARKGINYRMSPENADCRRKGYRPPEDAARFCAGADQGWQGRPTR